MHSLRFDGETDAAFRARAVRAGEMAHVLVAACLQNRQVQHLLATGEWTEPPVRHHPLVRIEFEQVIAIGGIGETLAATRSKHWGKGPWLMPLRPDDEFFPDRITYLYRDNSLYNQRFEQRRRLKELLGKQHRGLVSHAQHRLVTQAIFLRDLTDDQRRAIRRLLNVGPVEFWRASRGKTFLSLPGREIQRELPFDEPSMQDADPIHDGSI